jgi:hypothetical protein
MSMRVPGLCLMTTLLALTLAAAAAAGAETTAPVTPPSPGSAEVPPAVAPAPSAPAPTPTVDKSLSDERTLTTWAHPVEELSIYAHPDLHSHKLARLRLETEDGFPEVYLLLTSHVDAAGQSWVKLRVPGRPNGRKGWVLREALGGFHETHWLIVVSLRKHTLTAYYKGRRRMLAPVGVGKPSTPTPSGSFWIRERFRITSRKNPYWPYALGTSDYSTLSEWPGGGVVGIHGDFGEPQFIPGDPSHGCVRMRDADIGWLAPRITLGTPVHII